MRGEHERIGKIAREEWEEDGRGMGGGQGRNGSRTRENGGEPGRNGSRTWKEW